MRSFNAIFVLLLSFFLCLEEAYAYCGNDNAGINACPTPDQDNDDYSSAGTGRLTGTDCDDTNWQIYPGITTGTGCGAGQVHTCQASGSYTSCIALSAYSAKSGSGADYWVDPAGVSTAGCGAFGSPCDYRCWSNPALGCFHAPGPGDAMIMRGGNYTGTWSDLGTTRMLWIYLRNGTPTDRISIVSAPGESPNIVGQGVAAPAIFPFQVFDSSNILISGITIHSGFSDTGIYFAAVPGAEVRNVTVYDINGLAANNLSGVKFTSGCTGIYIHHSLLYDNYDRVSPGAQNNTTGVRGFSSDSFRIENNVARSTYVTGSGYGYSIKHGLIGATNNKILNNVVDRSRWDGIQNETPSIEIAYNRIYNANLQNSGSAIGLVDIGQNAEFKDMNVHNNLIVNASALEIVPTDIYAPIGAHVLDYNGNVVIDNAASYPLDGSEGFLRVCNYCSNAIYTNVVTGGKLSFAGNCYYNTLGATLLFDLFSDSGSGSFGQNYFGLPTWKAAGFGYDTNSFNENPLLDADDMPTSTNCAGKGWRPAATAVNWGILTKRLTRGRR